MHTKTTVLSTFGLIIAGLIASACASEDVGTDPVAVNVNALTTEVSGVTFCAEGNIDIVGPTTVSIPTDCDDTSHEVILLPGAYTATISSLDCSASEVPPGAEEFVSCSMTTTPVAFTVTAGGTIDVNIGITYNYLGLEPFSVWYGAGSAVFRLSTPPTVNTTLDLCGLSGQYVICSQGRSCATVDGQGPACYADCTAGGNTCGTGATCMPIVGGNSVDGAPAVVLPGTEDDLDAILHVCIPAAQSGIGVGGAGGAGGATP